jgi:putative ABC transport system permease protein
VRDLPRVPRVLRLWRRGRVVAEVQDEFAFHIEMRTNELRDAGMSPADARAEALRQFGDLSDATMYCRRTGERRERRTMRTEWVSGLRQDVSFAVRTLRKAPGFTAVAVLTLAIAIGATTAVFSIVNGVLLKPLPFTAPERLMRVGTTRGASGRLTSMSYPDFIDYRSQSHQIGQMSLIDRGTKNLTAAGSDPLRLSTARVSANFFDVLAVKVELGRGFVAGDDTKGANATLVLSDALWHGRFGGDRSIVGKTILLDGKPIQVIGVAPPSVTYPRSVDAWLAAVPEALELDPDSRGGHYLDGVGRLAPTGSLAGAATELKTIGTRLAEQYPETDAEFGASAVELRETMVGAVRPALKVMLACVACLLLIACANVANLLLVRAAGRESEIAVRTALGAGRLRLIRQLVTESIMLSTAGAVFGTALAAWILSVVKAAGPRGVPRLGEVTLDGTVLLFTAAITLGTGIIFGLVPALYAARSDIGNMLKGNARGSSGRRSSHRLRAVLVSGEIALALVLLIGAGLLSRSFMQLLKVDNGFDPDHVVTLSFSLPNVAYPWDRQQRGFADDLVQRVAHIPGVQSSGVVFGRPLEDRGMGLTFNRDDQPPTPPGKPNVSSIRVASPGFFQALGIKLVAGRLFNDGDRPGGPMVFVVSEELAKRYFPNENALGKRISFGWGRDTSAAGQNVPTAGEIVGIVKDVKQQGPAAEVDAATYISNDQLPMTDMSLIVRSRAEPATVINAARAQIKAIDAQLPIYNAKSMDDLLSESVAQPRFYAILLGAFAGIALLLSGLGIYGVIAYSVSQRTRELGIRLALGAGRASVIQLVLRQGIALIAAGVTCGLLVAIGATRLMAVLLFGVNALDIETFATVTLVLVVVAVTATWIPAARASGVDPVVAMRAE